MTQSRGIRKNIRTKRWATAAQMIADGSTNDAVAKTLGVSQRAVDYWRTEADFRAQVAAIVDERARALAAEGIANKANQLKALQSDWDRTEQVITERGADGKIARAPGGKSGIVTRKIRSVPNADPSKPPMLDTEDAVDTGLLTARMNLLKQAAQTAGWWAEKREITGENGGPIAVRQTFDWEAYNRLYAQETGALLPEASDE